MKRNRGKNMTEQKNISRLKGTYSTKVIRVIETKSICGKGTTDNPIHMLVQYWDFDGNLLAVRDEAG